MENDPNNPYNGLQPPPVPTTPEKQAERGGCLTALLIFMMIGSGISILLYLAMGDKIARQARIPGWAPYLMIFFSIIQLICIYLTYTWKKIGVIGMVTLSVIILFVNLSLKLGPMSFAGLVGAVILIILVQPNWKHFK